MWIIIKELADIITNTEYAENCLFNPVNIDGKYVISDIEKCCLMERGHDEIEFELCLETNVEA